MNNRNIINSWNLYVITDEKLGKKRSHLDIAKAAIAGGAEVIQLRDKKASSKKLFQTAIILRKLAQQNKVSLIINDRLDIALAVNGDGVHVGQTDIPAHVTRKLIGPDKILGVSACSVEEALEAEAQGADYLGVGPIFEARGTKTDARAPLGLSLLNLLREKCKIPLVAIGGINQDNVKEVIQAGATAAAIISAIVSSEDIQSTTRSIIEIIKITKGEVG
jgi:thiamine-phosphate pyrophosphorylase